jgi:hypothetical protein
MSWRVADLFNVAMGDPGIAVCRPISANTRIGKPVIERQGMMLNIQLGSNFLVRTIDQWVG